MHKASLFRLILYLIAVGVFSLPFVVISADPGSPIQEGAQIVWHETHHNSADLLIEATKRFNGQPNEIEIAIRYDYAYVDGQRHVDSTVVLSQDSAQLVVSDDLSSASLEATFSVDMRRIDCDLSVSPWSCGPEYVQTVPVEIHVALAANGPVTPDNGVFRRPATVTGSRVIGDHGGPFFPSGLSGSIFSNHPRQAQDLCKDGGWRTLGYRNQGECISSLVSQRP